MNPYFPPSVREHPALFILLYDMTCDFPRRTTVLEADERGIFGDDMGRELVEELYELGVRDVRGCREGSMCL